jgi:hypothetical protein
MRIAILGAGGVGTCAALELALRGYDVELFDEQAEPLTQASRNNEGKIHLGLVYAKDRSLETAKTMIQGAIHFTACLERWIDLASMDPLVSTPYYYAVHKDTMTDPVDLELHYGSCQRLFDEACSATGLSYLGRERRLMVEKVSIEEMAGLVAPHQCLRLYRTNELAVDVRGIADRLSAAVRASPRIRFRSGASVLSVTRSGAEKLCVAFRDSGTEQRENYDHVANTLWHGRLEVDSTYGLTPERGWIYRYKLGGWINLPMDGAAIPTVTFVLGPFGDIVNLGRRGLYFSWYPAGMVATSQAVKPPDWDRQIPESRRRAILRDSYAAVRSLCPALHSVEYSDDTVEAAGGVIFAWGATDIDHHRSRLHTRHEIGIRSAGNYHTVNTGKYAMVPYLGYKIAERILRLPSDLVSVRSGSKWNKLRR